jgi:hypothetical protein
VKKAEENVAAQRTVLEKMAVADAANAAYEAALMKLAAAAAKKS